MCCVYVCVYVCVCVYLLLANVINYINYFAVLSFSLKLDTVAVAKTLEFTLVHNNIVQFDLSIQHLNLYKFDCGTDNPNNVRNFA